MTDRGRMADERLDEESSESFWERYEREEHELEKYGECVCLF